MLLAHVGPQHAPGAAQILRLGPLLPLGLVLVTAAATWTADWRTRLRRAGAVALVTAGLLHVGLISEHFRDTVAAGAFFAVSSIAELGVGSALFARRSRFATRAAVAIVVVLLVVYSAARVVRLPFTTGREELDALGLVTKALEVLAALFVVAAEWRRQPRLCVPTAGLVALPLAVVALVSRPLFGEGPSTLHAAVALAAAVTVVVMADRAWREMLPVALVDGAIVGLLVRAPSAVTVGAVAAAATLLRLAVRRRGQASPPWH